MTKEECLELELELVKDFTLRLFKECGIEEYIINPMFSAIHGGAWLQYEEET